MTHASLFVQKINKLKKGLKLECLVPKQLQKYTGVEREAGTSFFLQNSPPQVINSSSDLNAFCCIL